MIGIKSFLLVGFLALVSCNSTKSLQEYYVDNEENPNFLSIDVPASVLDLDKADLTQDQRKAVASLRKLNVLAFKKTGENALEYEKEKADVTAILKNKDYTDLIKLRTQWGNATVKYLGNEEAIDEVVVFGTNDDKGFAVVRILGKDMNPALLFKYFQALQKSDYKGEGLEQVFEMIKG